MERDRDATRARLMEAAERLIVREGLVGCGVNAIAHEAGVDKVLIYRYFGGATALLSEVIASRGAWPRPNTVESSTGHGAGSCLAAKLVDQARDIRARPLARRALAWEAAGHASADVSEAIGREPATARVVAELRSAHASLPSQLDLEAVTALVAAGLVSLAVRGDAAVPFFGIDASNDAHWRRVEKAATMMLRTLLDPSDV